MASPKIKIKNARFHTGAQVGMKVLNSVALEKDGVISIDMLDAGIHIKTIKGEDFIPYTNILSMSITSEEAPAKPAK